MNSQLKSENSHLRQQLESLLVEARRNEDRMRRFDRLERKIIGAETLKELIDLLLSEYQLAFGVEFVTISLVDREYEIARILDGEQSSTSLPEGLKLVQSADPLEALFKGSHKPFLGAFSEHHNPFFNVAPHTIASVALLPLVRHGRLIGSLHFGSTDPNRYAGDSGTDFLERLAEIIAVCIESAMTQERLKLMGLTDGLTGVQNRRYFERRLQEEISQACRHKRSLACLFLDIDRFKRINDTFGHQTGDAVLRSVASVIQAQLRVGDTIARYGGEEFVVLLPRTAGNHVHEIAERIRCNIAQKPFETTSGEIIAVTISIGLSMLPMEQLAKEPQLLAAQLVSSADKALYQAKHTGRNRVVSDAGLTPGLQPQYPSSQASGTIPALTELFRAALDMTSGVRKHLKRVPST